MIQRTFPGTYRAVDHAGSTSIAGVAAKPVIDLDVVLRASALEQIRLGLERLSHVHEGDFGIPGRDAFDLRDDGLCAPLAEHHLSVFEPRSKPLEEYQLFRDFMLVRPDWVEHLCANRRALALQYEHDRYGYQKAKSPMVEEILALARADLVGR
jgi:GrpB-like predicted nucleotidyltransferase (UPF0157 family)